MIIKPKVRGFVCVTSHPAGCAAHVQEWIDHVMTQGAIKDGPKKVLVIGSSTGYGLASRITAAFGSGAATLGVFFDRPSEEGRPATPGWYNTIAFTNEMLPKLQAQGFNITDSCQKGGGFFPGAEKPTACDTPDTYLFWDLNHLTAVSNKILAEAWFKAIVYKP